MAKEVHSLLFRGHELVIVWRAVFVVTSVTNHTRKAFLNQLFGDIAEKPGFSGEKDEFKLIRLTLIDCRIGQSRIHARQIRLPLDE